MCAKCLNPALVLLPIRQTTLIEFACVIRGQCIPVVHSEYDTRAVHYGFIFLHDNTTSVSNFRTQNMVNEYSKNALLSYGNKAGVRALVRKHVPTEIISNRTRGKPTITMGLTID